MDYHEENEEAKSSQDESCPSETNMSPIEPFSTQSFLGLHTHCQWLARAGGICPTGCHTKHFTRVPLLNAHHSDIPGMLVRAGFRCSSNLTQVPLYVHSWVFVESCRCLQLRPAHESVSARLLPLTRCPPPSFREWQLACPASGRSQQWLLGCPAPGPLHSRF